MEADDEFPLATLLLKSSCGLAFDIGGSVIKILCLRKQSEASALPKACAKSFPRSKLTEALSYIKETAKVNRDGGCVPVVYCTGLGGNQLACDMQSMLNIKLSVMAEGDMYGLATVYLIENVPRMEAVLPLSLDVIEKQAEQSKRTLNSYKDYKSPLGLTLGEFPEDKDFAVDEYVDNITGILSNERDGDKPFSADGDCYPCMLMNCGSAFCFNKIYKDKCSYLEGSLLGGKAFLGMGQAMLGAKNYEELMLWAEQGDSNKVDNTMGDLRPQEESSKSDHQAYSIVDNVDTDVAAFCFGKCAEQPSGAFKKEDLARALLRSYCMDLAQLIELGVRNTDVTHIFLSGSFVSHELTRRMVTQELTERIIMKAVLGGGTKPLKFHFVQNGAYLGALGCLVQANTRQSST